MKLDEFDDDIVSDNVTYVEWNESLFLVLANSIRHSFTPKFVLVVNVQKPEFNASKESGTFDRTVSLT